MNNNHKNIPTPKIKIKLTNNEILYFDNAEVTITPNAIFLINKNNPNITKIFPFANIVELDIPGRFIASKIQKPI